MRRVVFAAAALLASGCHPSRNGMVRGGAPASPAVTPVAASSLPQPELKYLLIAKFGMPFWCPWDLFPVGRQIPPAERAARVAALKAGQPDVYAAVVAHLGYGERTLGDAENLQIDRNADMLAAVAVSEAAGGWAFDFHIGKSGPGERIHGVIAGDGTIVSSSREPTQNTCPKCLAAGTLIATPAGPIAVERLRPGMAVWSADAAGARISAVIVETVRRPVSPGTALVHLVLDDGRAVWLSGAHPLFDGTPAGAALDGAAIDGAHAVSTMREARGEVTYDLLPSGPTGAYWANGILLGSTLR